MLITVTDEYTILRKYKIIYYSLRKSTILILSSPNKEIWSCLPTLSQSTIDASNFNFSK